MSYVFIPKEIAPGERRVAATPATVKILSDKGFSVVVERGCGYGSFIEDQAFEAAGATLSEHAAKGFEQADLTLMINPPSEEQAYQLKSGSSLVSFLYPANNESVVRILAERSINAFAMEAIPRITRAQKCDALSSQSNLAGYQAVLMAAAECPKLFPLMMTAAGTLRPARVVVIGAGVAGLQAIATAKRLGALVEVSDIRPAVKEQVESLGASYIEVPSDEDLETEGGYAKEVTPEFLKQQSEITRKHLVKADAVITSALVPGKQAPRLISEEVVKEMKWGSVIVDMAAEQGGNCELTVAGETVERHGVTIVGALNLPSAVAVHASEAYARNVLNIVTDQLGDQNEFAWQLEDEIVDGALLIHNGEIRRPA